MDEAIEYGVCQAVKVGNWHFVAHVAPLQNIHCITKRVSEVAQRCFALQEEQKANPHARIYGPDVRIDVWNRVFLRNRDDN